MLSFTVMAVESNSSSFISHSYIGFGAQTGTTQISSTVQIHTFNSTDCPLAAGFDGDYGTSQGDLYCSGQYLKPAGSTSMTWNITTQSCGTFVVPIPSSCWNFNSTHVGVIFWWGEGYGGEHYYCINNNAADIAFGGPNLELLAVEAEGCNGLTEESAYFSVLSDGSNNVSHGFGQIIIGNLSGSTKNLQKGIFYIQNFSIANVSNISVPVAVCDNAHMNICTNQTACVAVGGYWYDGSCHTNPSGSGGGNPGGSPSQMKYIIYPTEFFMTLNQYQTVYKTFYIENLEFSSPLTIEIEPKYGISPTRFDVAPGRRAQIDFAIYGGNKSGYQNETLTVNVLKNIANYEITKIKINYFVRNATMIVINGTIQNATIEPPRNSTFIDLIPFIKDKPKLKADLTIAAKTVNNFLTHPMFLVVVLCALCIVVIIMQQMSAKTELGVSSENIGKSPWFYAISAFVGVWIVALLWYLSTLQGFWARIRLAYTHPAFLIVVFSLLIVLLILITQLRKTQEKGFKWAKFVVIATIIGVFALIAKNADLIGRLLYRYPDFYKSPWVYIVCISLVAIVLIILFQIRKKEEEPQ